MGSSEQSAEAAATQPATGLVPGEADENEPVAPLRRSKSGPMLVRRRRSFEGLDPQVLQLLKNKPLEQAEPDAPAPEASSAAAAAAAPSQPPRLQRRRSLPALSESEQQQLVQALSTLPIEGSPGATGWVERLAHDDGDQDDTPGPEPAVASPAVDGRQAVIRRLSELPIIDSPTGSEAPSRRTSTATSGADLLPGSTDDVFEPPSPVLSAPVSSPPLPAPSPPVATQVRSFSKKEKKNKKKRGGAGLREDDDDDVVEYPGYT